MLFTTIHLNLWIVGLGLILMGICNGITFPTTNFTAVHSLPSEKKGIGLGIFTTTSSLMSSVGVALSAVTSSFVSSAHFSKLLNQNNLSPLAHQSSLHNIVTGAHPFSLLAEVNPNHSAILAPLVQHSFMRGFHWVMILYVILSGLALYFCRYIHLPHHPEFKLSAKITLLE